MVISFRIFTNIYPYNVVIINEVYWITMFVKACTLHNPHYLCF